MTSAGSAYTRFRRALATGNLTLVRTAAAELPYAALPDALQVCLLLRDGDQVLYERAAVRWTGRFALEGRDVDLGTVQSAAAALDALPREPQGAMDTPAALCPRRAIT
jgi:hypothetical protein